MCDSVLSSTGRLRTMGPASLSLDRRGNHLPVTVASLSSAAVRRDQSQEPRLGCEPREVASILRRMVEAGCEVTDFRREEMRLEDAFIEKLKKNGSSA
jgi:hypothetical protein